MPTPESSTLGGDEGNVHTLVWGGEMGVQEDRSLKIKKLCPPMTFPRGAGERGGRLEST